MVHWNIFSPPPRFVTLEFSDVGVVIVAEPEMSVQDPVPIAGVFPASTVVVAQIV